MNRTDFAWRGLILLLLWGSLFRLPVLAPFAALPLLAVARRWAPPAWATAWTQVPILALAAYYFWAASTSESAWFASVVAWALCAEAAFWQAMTAMMNRKRRAAAAAQAETTES